MWLLRYNTAHLDQKTTQMGSCRGSYSHRPISDESTKSLGIKTDSTRQEQFSY
jgi:hypothetical protein